MKRILVSLLFLVPLVTLASCNQSQGEKRSEKEKSKIVLVPELGGVNDRSFSQVGWEGLETWGKKKRLTVKKDLMYMEMNNPKDSSTSTDRAIGNGFTTITSLGYL